MSWSISKDTTDCHGRKRVRETGETRCQRVKGMAGVGSGPLSLGAS